MDNNNFSRRNRNINTKKGFMDRQGMYIIVVVCLILVGVAAYFTFNSISNLAKKPTPPSEQVLVQPTPTPKATATQTAKPEPTPTPSEEPVVVPSAKPAAQAMAMPLAGEVLRPYSAEDPIYFEALKEWMVHTGVDLSAKEGTEIKACLDGTVESMVNDPALGYTITVVSDVGKKVVYANVGTMEKVKKGQTVKQGDVISVIGNSASATKGDPPHLHLEYYENDAHKDPMKAMKQ